MKPKYKKANLSILLEDKANNLFNQNYSYTEIAKELGISYSGVYMLFYRAKGGLSDET